MTFEIVLRKACSKSRPPEQSRTGAPQQFSTNLLNECPNVLRMVLLSDDTLVTDQWYSLRPTIFLDPRIWHLNFQGLSSLRVKLDCTSLSLFLKSPVTHLGVPHLCACIGLWCALLQSIFFSSINLRMLSLLDIDIFMWTRLKISSSTRFSHEG